MDLAQNNERRRPNMTNHESLPGGVEQHPQVEIERAELRHRAQLLAESWHFPEHRDYELEREREPMENPPMIYVASLSDYNAGELHGVWLDARDELERMELQVEELLAQSNQFDAEEIAIHDFQGFRAWRPGEYESLAAVKAVADAIVEHGEPVTHWIGYLGAAGIQRPAPAVIEGRQSEGAATDPGKADEAPNSAPSPSLGSTIPEAIETFEEAYFGEWSSVRDYAESLADDLGVELRIRPSSWERYAKIDFDAMARDLEIELYCVESGLGRVMIFNPAVT
jgi:antirestriction protein